MFIKKLFKIFSITIFLLSFQGIRLQAQNNIEETLIYDLQLAAQEFYKVNDQIKQNVQLKRQIEFDFANLNEQWDKWSKGKQDYSRQCLGEKLEHNQYEFCMNYWNKRNNQREQLVRKEKFLDNEDNRRLKEAKNLKQQHDQINERISTLKVALKMTAYGQQYPNCFNGNNQKLIECLFDY